MCLGAVKPVRTDLQYRARNKLRSERRERRNAVPLWLPVRMPTGQGHAGSSVLYELRVTKANRIEIRPFLSLGQEHQNLSRDYVFKHP